MITNYVKSVNMGGALEVLRKTGRGAFRTREYAALVGNSGYARVALHRLKNKGEIFLVKRGWWAFANAAPEAIACRVSEPCFVSFHSALYLHGLTTQIPKFVQLAVLRNAKAYEIPGYKAKEYKIKRGFFKGFKAKDGVLLATPEKAFADCLNAPRACPKAVMLEAKPGISLEEARKTLSTSGLRRLERLW